MYKNFKLSKRLSIAFNKFPKTAKEVNKVYLTGIRNWTSDDSFNYSIVLGTFRVIFHIEKENFCCQQ